MTEPTARDLLACVEMNNARIRGPDGASARVLAAYREELLAASAQSAEPSDGVKLCTDAIASLDKAMGIARELYASAGQSAEPQEDRLGPAARAYVDERMDRALGVLAIPSISNNKAEPQEAGKPSIDDIDRVEGAVDCYAKLYKEPAAQWSWRRIKSALRARLASKPSRAEAADRTALDLLGEVMSYDTWANFPQNLRDRAESYLRPYDTEEKLARPSREEEMREALIKAGRDEWFRDTTTISWSRIERALRAALAQGGARDEGDGKR